jgi:hypothetical protein
MGGIIVYQIRTSFFHIPKIISNVTRKSSSFKWHFYVKVNIALNNLGNKVTLHSPNTRSEIQLSIVGEGKRMLQTWISVWLVYRQFYTGILNILCYELIDVPFNFRQLTENATYYPISFVVKRVKIGLTTQIKRS